jgi:hypothetical protein
MNFRRKPRTGLYALATLRPQPSSFQTSTPSNFWSRASRRRWSSRGAGGVKLHFAALVRWSAVILFQSRASSSARV